MAKKIDDLLADSLVEISRKKSLDSITVTELVTPQASTARPFIITSTASRGFYDISSGKSRARHLWTGPVLKNGMKISAVPCIV